MNVWNRDLTERERQVLLAASEGLSNKEIARKIGISPETVKDRMSMAMRRMGVNNRVQAVVIAVKNGLC